MAKKAHEGVKIIRLTYPEGHAKYPSGGEFWVARWRDPDSRKVRQTSFGKLGKTTKEAREAWATAKAKEVRNRIVELAAGSPRHKDLTVPDAVDDYLTRVAQHHRPKTVEIYRSGLDRLLEWAEKTGIRRCCDLTPELLVEFRDWLRVAKRKVAVRGGKRGQQRAARVRLSPRGVNQRLNSVRIALNDFRRRGVVSRLSKDSIADNLRAVQVDRDRPVILGRKEVRELLRASLRHDRATFKETREEHRGDGESGSTLRYEPIAPFVLVLLLSGCRIGELLALRWRNVDLEADDGAGAFEVTSTSSKTHQARTVTLQETPTVAAVLASLKVQAGRDAKVFRGMTYSGAQRVRRRLPRHGAPAFTWHDLRRTAVAFSVCSSAIWGANPLGLACLRYGHAAPVALQCYARLVRVPKEATTLEAAMGIEREAAAIVAAVQGEAPDLEALDGAS